MKRIKLDQQPQNKDWSMQFVDDNHYDVVFDEDVTIWKPNGQPLMVLLKNALSRESVSTAWSVLKGFNPVTENRGTASGTEAVKRTKINGEKSQTTRVPKGWEVGSGIIGFFERIPRFPYTHACAWNQNNPEKFSSLFPMVSEVSKLFQTHIPDRHRVQQGFVDRTCKDYVIPDSVFTTLTVNKNFRTACHKDVGDLTEGFSCMSIIRQGKYRGGRLVLPDWKIAAELDTFDVIMFDAHEFHGNTQIVPLTKDAIRCSVVYYYREKMVHSLPPAQELEWAKNRKPGEPLYER